MDYRKRLERLDAHYSAPEFVPNKTEAEIDQELADALIGLHDAKPDEYERMMTERAPAWLVAFADEVIAAR